MATESADGPDVTVRLPPDLDEWVEKRANALGVDRGELLVQLVGSYRAATDLDDESLPDVVAADEAMATAETVEEELTSTTDALADLNERIESIESDLEENVEDVRTRILQLRDGVRDSAPEDHTHHEFSRFESRAEDLSSELETVSEDVASLSGRLEILEGQLEDIDGKLTSLARAVVGLRRASSSHEADTLTEARRAANRRGVSEADCGACGTAVDVALLTEATCPHCDTAFERLSVPADGLARTLGFRRSTLVPESAPASEPEGDDE